MVSRNGSMPPPRAIRVPVGEQAGLQNLSLLDFAVVPRSLNLRIRATWNVAHSDHASVGFVVNCSKRPSEMGIPQTKPAGKYTWRPNDPDAFFQDLRSSGEPVYGNQTAGEFMDEFKKKMRELMDRHAERRTCRMLRKHREHPKIKAQRKVLKEATNENERAIARH